MSDTVRAFKLINGQEIIGICEEWSADDAIQMTKVRELAPVDNGTGGWNLSLMPFLLSSIDGKFMLNAASTVGEITNIPAALEKEYRNAVSTIKIATSLNG